MSSNPELPPITQTYVEDAVAHTVDFLDHERGANIDGAALGSYVDQRLISHEEAARDILQSAPLGNGFYMSLDRRNSSRYDEALAALPHHNLLVTSAMVEGHGDRSEFYPAIVSEDSLAHNALRLHVLLQPFRRQLGFGATALLSGAGQSETPLVGGHDNPDGVGVEAEHFTSLQVVSSNPDLQAAWLSGQHVNHGWRQQQDGSVTTQLAEKLLAVPQRTITVGREQIARGDAMLLWHDSLVDEDGQPARGNHPHGLVIVQSLGFEAMRRANPDALTNLRGMLA